MKNREERSSERSSPAATTSCRGLRRASGCCPSLWALRDLLARRPLFYGAVRRVLLHWALEHGEGLPYTDAALGCGGELRQDGTTL